MNIDWNALHLVRPNALWLLLALPLIAALWYWRRRRGSAWHSAVDAHLLRHLLVAGGQRAWGGLMVLLLGWTLAVVALAGPSWRQVAQPLWQSPAPLVVALDLSSRVTATDLPPSRLLQARAKLAALLRERKGGEVALLVYADDAYTVAPLTADTANVALYLDALGPDVMPRDGQRAERALDAAVLLLQQSGARSGDILLLTDRADAAASSAATAARRQGVTVSVLGVGTPTGAAYRSGDGQIAQARLEEASLRAVASAGGGQYARMASDDGDLRALGVLTPKTSMDDRRDGNGMAWRDEGFLVAAAVDAAVVVGVPQTRPGRGAGDLPVGAPGVANPRACCRRHLVDACRPGGPTGTGRGCGGLPAGRFQGRAGAVRRYRQRRRLVQPGQCAGAPGSVRRRDRGV